MIKYADEYVDAVLAEARNRCDELSGEPLRTVYIGGGTPSVLPLPTMLRLLEGIKSVFPLADVEEFTVEMNPDDVTKDYVTALRRHGVNRISMGVQTLVDDELRFIHRRHNAEQAERAVATVRSCGVSNVSIDLIYGIPGQTLDTWAYSVDRAIALDVEHISAYSMMYEDGTALSRMVEQGSVTPVDDEVCVAMMDYLVKRLREAGYEQYEISNFSKCGKRSQHNSSYWVRTPYLGLGAAAHSFTGGNRRRWNVADVRKYLAGGEQSYEFETLSERDCYNEDVMLRLRTAAGISTDFIAHHYGATVAKDFQRCADTFVRRSLMHRTPSNSNDSNSGNSNNIYRLTEAAISISDTIIRELIKL